MKVLPVDKGNVTMVLGTTHYKWKITALLEDHANRKLKNPTESAERKTVLLLKQF
jgi:hypothetical protein